MNSQPHDKQTADFGSIFPKISSVLNSIVDRTETDSAPEKTAYSLQNKSKHSSESTPN